MVKIHGWTGTHSLAPRLGVKQSTSIPHRIALGAFRPRHTPVLRWCYYLPNTVISLGPWPSGSLDELCPSPANLYTIFLHLGRIFHPNSVDSIIIVLLLT